MENELEITKVVKSDRIETVDSRGGKRTKMPSTVSLVVDHRFANEAQELLMDLKEGKTADHGLIGMELVAVYAQPKPEEAEKIVENLNTDLDNAGQGGGHET